MGKATISKQHCGLDEAYEDIRAGRITHYADAEDFFKAFKYNTA